MGDVSTAAEEWRRYAPLALAAAIGFSFMSFMTPAAGIFMEPLSRQFGWNRTQLSAGLGIAGLIGMVGSPLVGVLLDRYGARRLALPGIVLTAVASSAFSLASGSVAQWLLLWMAWGLAALLVQSTTWSTAVASVFFAARGLALGLTLSGTALAQVVVPPLCNWLIATRGWRAAYVWLGLGWGALALLLSLLFLFDARDRERLAQAGTHVRFAARPDMAGLSRAQAWRSSALWRIAIATFLILTVTIAILVHQFPILVEAGATRETAAWLASLAGVAGIAGKVITGTLIDRFHARWVGGITLASTAIAYPILIAPFRTIPLIALAVAISGYAAGTKIQLCGYLTARYGGMRHYGAIFGFMTSMIALSGAVGPVAAGASYDHYGSYAPLLIVATILSLVSGALIFSLGAYPDWRGEDRHEPTA